MESEGMPERIKRQLLRMASDEFPKEICGFITKGFKEIISITNVAEKGHEFDMCKEELLKLYRERLPDLIGMYHSHPIGRIDPSEEDFKYAPQNMRYWIVIPNALQVAEWDMTGDQPKQIS